MNAFYTFIDHILDAQAKFFVHSLSTDKIQAIDIETSSRKVLKQQHLAIVKRNATKALEDFLEDKEIANVTGNVDEYDIDIDDETILEEGLCFVVKGWRDGEEDDGMGRFARVRGAVGMYVVEMRKGRVLEWVRRRREEISAVMEEEDEDPAIPGPTAVEENVEDWGVGSDGSTEGTNLVDAQDSPSQVDSPEAEGKEKRDPVIEDKPLSRTQKRNKKKAAKKAREEAASQDADSPTAQKTTLLGSASAADGSGGVGESSDGEEDEGEKQEDEPSDLFRGLDQTWDDMGPFGWLVCGFLVFFILAYIGGYEGGQR